MVTRTLLKALRLGEDHTYDPDILSEERAIWTQSVRCAGLNPYANSTTKCFVSGEGRMDKCGMIDLDSFEDDDPNFPNGIALKTYGHSTKMPSAYPSHTKCLDIFMCVLAHKAGVKWTKSHRDACDDWLLSAPQIDKETLYSVLDSIAEIGPFSFLGTDYGMLLPFELLEKIFSWLDVSGLINILQASPHLYRSFGNSPTFWHPVLDFNMPWFFELEIFNDGALECYEIESSPNPNDQDDDFDHTAPSSAHGKSLHRLCLWANKATETYHGMEGSFMGVANRRRIWTVCEPIVERYLSQAAYPGQEPTNGKTIDLDPQILKSATCFWIPLVSIPKPKKYHPETVFWVRDWNDIDSAFTLKIFWNFKKNLVGLGVKIHRNYNPDLRLFGASDSQDGYTVNTMQVQDGDWIQGFILHYPQIYAPPENNEVSERDETDVVGITVLLHSGRKESFGDIEAHRVKRLMMAAERMVIVGLTGHVGERETPTGMVDIISRIGLVQCPMNRDSIEGEERPDENFHVDGNGGQIWSRSPLLKTLPLTDDSSSIFTMEDIGSLSSNADLQILCLSLQITRTPSATGVSIWDLPNLRIHQTPPCTDEFPPELKAYQPLIWAKNKSEARALRQLTCYKKERGFGTLVYGLRADYAPLSMIKRRQIKSQMSGIGPTWKNED
ncbi:uncharacterized protein N7483_005767 [Penicillium malachiteum]|uniref:uncharacterized protein n=1 Tax=Penicillium malachiteum TaxID=1324776 RepID=UPI002546A0F0|nr:uncharacterized protein N7483_005767 [Penicillium malachiteum]KAJ5731259.1 hypothetical protein N7483_005767 [Penicillium malachiteum]